MKKDYLLVGVQLLLFSIYALRMPSFDVYIRSFPIISRMSLVLTMFGILIIVLAFLQLNKNLSPFPTPKENGQLIKNGLYQWVRHPIYTGLIIGGLGYSFYTNSLLRLVVIMALYILFEIKSRYEEELLSNRFPDYASYMKTTGRFFPKILTSSK